MVNSIRSMLIVLGILLLSASVSAQADTLPNGVAAGDVTQTSAVLWTRSTEPGAVTFEYSTDAGFADIDGTATADVSDPMLPVKVSIGDLTPGTAYFYRVTDAAGNTAEGRFRTPAEVGAKAGLRFGVSGDWRGELAPFPSVSNADERDLDFFVLHGDTIYSDYPSPDLDKPQAETLADYRIKHNEVYSQRYGLNTLADLRASTAVLAMIDDHEVTNDFAGGAPLASDARFDGSDAEFINDAGLYETGLQAFQEYNPLRDEFYGDTGDPRTAGERKLYRFQTYGSDAAVFLLDARSFRDAGLPAVTEFTRESVGQYMAASFQPGRTMLGAQQLSDLKADLLRAQQDGITWKFILAPEPVQNFGVVNASDRFEGYAAERTDLIRFIVENDVTNVVFIAADIHGTIINNITYQTEPGGEQLQIDAFEISTGAVAFDAPFGPTVFQLAFDLGFVTQQQKNLYTLAPLPLKENFVSQLINGQIEPLGYDPIGLDGSPLDADLVSGGWLATHTYGWTEFQIDAATQQLRVITYGIPAYTKAQLDADPAAITAREPVVLSEFTVNPQ